MYSILKNIHSYWAYLVLLILALALLNAIFGIIKEKDFESRDLRISLFGLIFSHIQFLIGLILYFVSPWLGQWSAKGFGSVMGDSQARLYLVEHPITNILAIVVVTMGWSLHKRQSDPRKKFLRIAFFYGFGLILLLSRIPWKDWL